MVFEWFLVVFQWVLGGFGRFSVDFGLGVFQWVLGVFQWVLSGFGCFF